MKACVRFRRRLTALCAVLLLLLLAVPSAHAQEGDLDRINQYTVTVDPRVDGSADMLALTYFVDSLESLTQNEPFPSSDAS